VWDLEGENKFMLLLLVFLKRRSVNRRAVRERERRWKKR